MGDLPPSYEAATGISAAPQQNSNNEPPPKPSAPEDGQIIATQYTNTRPTTQTQTILAPQHLQQPSYPPAVTVNSSYPTSLPTPQTNVVMRGLRPSKGGKKRLCITIAIVFFIVVGLIVALVAVKSSKPKYKPDFSNTFESIYGQPEYPKIDWDTVHRNNEELLERLSKIYETPEFDFDFST